MTRRWLAFAALLAVAAVHCQQPSPYVMVGGDCAARCNEQYENCLRACAGQSCADDCRSDQRGCFMRCPGYREIPQEEVDGAVAAAETPRSDYSLPVDWLRP